MHGVWFFFVITSVRSMNPVMQDAIFYDEYGDENPGVVSTGGHILITCKISDCSNDGAHVQLVDTLGTLVDSAPCAEQVFLRLNISRSTVFGEYRCKYANQMSEKPFDYQYRMCSPHDAACTQSCDHRKSHLCIVRSDNTSLACITPPDDNDFPEAYCKPQLEPSSTTENQHVVYCGAETEGVEQPKSMCEAYSRGLWTKKLTRVFDPNVTAMCQMHGWNTFIPADESNSRDPRVGAYPLVRNFMRPREARMFNSVYFVQKDETMMIKVPYHYIAYKATINCTLKSPNGTIISWNSIPVIGNNRIFFIKPFNITAFDLNFGIFAFKFACTFHNGDGMLLADTAFYAYYKVKKNPDGLGTRSLTCKPTINLPPQYALGRYVWNLRNYALHDDEMELDTNTSTHILKENGTYKCYIGVYIKCKEGDEEYDSVLTSHEIEVYDVLGRGTTTTERLPASAARRWMTSSGTKVILVLLAAAIGILSLHE